ncbi:glycosyltransferase [Vagococcus sp. CY52-2]|uniref:glycosyltransferase n=1 Tax=Vagococcus sp. CY52-2 TaxID=2925838 RepID=UPI001F59BE97|nr:glycosyltransferase [Vagococcus sp. CY52-2]UNM89967.1 glycosyltransferase [Vagococcus sp. CY52-2]
MKILIVTTVSVTMNFFEHLIDDLIDEGIEVHLATNFNYGNIKKINKDAVMHQIDFSRSIYSRDNINAYKQFKVLIEKNNFDIIHTHTPIASAIVRLQKNNIGKTIYTAHGFHFYKGAPRKNWLIFYPIEKILSYRTENLVTINNEDYNIANKKMHMKKLHLINGPGVNVPEILKINKLSRSELGLSEDDFILIFGAELNENKNQKLLIDSMELLVKKHKNIKLLLVGTDNFEGKYQNYTTEKGLSDNIIFLGMRNDLIPIIKVCDVAVSSSYREGLGLFLIEAGCCGLPIIATKNRGSSEIVVQGENGFLTDFTAYNFASEIEKIYSDRKLYDQLSSYSILNYEKFSVSTVNSKIKEIYKSIE